MLLNERFAKEGGSKFLYELFPGGPVARGSRLAGVPAPSDARDLSFGSTY
jgi:tRNA 2-thiouridine synthesizing protein E